MIRLIVLCDYLYITDDSEFFYYAPALARLYPTVKWGDDVAAIPAGVLPLDPSLCIVWVECAEDVATEIEGDDLLVVLERIDNA